MSIRMLVMDVDGTLTDGRLYIGSKGELMKSFDVKDGYAIARLKKNGIEPLHAYYNELFRFSTGCFNYNPSSIY